MRGWGWKHVKHRGRSDPTPNPPFSPIISPAVKPLEQSHGSSCTGSSLIAADVRVIVLYFTPPGMWGFHCCLLIRLSACPSTEKLTSRYPLDRHLSVCSH